MPTKVEIFDVAKNEASRPLNSCITETFVTGVSIAQDKLEEWKEEGDIYDVNISDGHIEYENKFTANYVHRIRVATIRVIKRTGEPSDIYAVVSEL